MTVRQWLAVSVAGWAALVGIAVVERAPGVLLLGALAWFAGRWTAARRLARQQT